MRVNSRVSVALLALAGVLAALPAAAEDSAARKQDEQAIRSTAKAYRAALAKGDAAALAEFWTADGDYIDDLGNAHPVSELTSEAGQATGQGAQPEPKVTTSKIRFLTADVAIEDGTSEVVVPDTQPAEVVRGHYHATWVRQDGRWRLANLCELPTPAADARLAQLDWMVGNWTADTGTTRWDVTTQWNATGTFLLRDIKAIQDGKVVQRGSQRFGWDPLSGKIKSWSFDSDGGIGEALWTKEGDDWVGQATGVLADGRQTSATTVITFDGKDSFSRKTLAGRVDGKSSPDQLVRFTRQAEPQR